VATETLVGVFGAGDGVALGVAEGDACVVGHLAGHAGPDGEGAWDQCVRVAACVCPGGVG
jgi:hypothetical protein